DPPGHSRALEAMIVGDWTLKWVPFAMRKTFTAVLAVGIGAFVALSTYLSMSFAMWDKTGWVSGAVYIWTMLAQCAEIATLLGLGALLAAAIARRHLGVS